MRKGMTPARVFRLHEAISRCGFPSVGRQLYFLLFPPLPSMLLEIFACAKQLSSRP
jgi:hypothetical protein